MKTMQNSLKSGLSKCLIWCGVSHNLLVMKSQQTNERTNGIEKEKRKKNLRLFPYVFEKANIGSTNSHV